MNYTKKTKINRYMIDFILKEIIIYLIILRIITMIDILKQLKHSNSPNFQINGGLLGGMESLPIHLWTHPILKLFNF